MDYITVRGRVGTHPTDILDVRGGDRVGVCLVRSKVDPRIPDWTECMLDLIDVDENDNRFYFFEIL